MKNNKTVSNRFYNVLNPQKGETLLSFVLVLPILFLITLITIDLARITMVQIALNKGARDGVLLAKSMPNLDINLNEFTTSSIEYLRFYEARRRIVRASLLHPITVFVTGPDTPSGAQLINYESVDKNVLTVKCEYENDGITVKKDEDGADMCETGELPKPLIAGAMLIRPGECVKNQETGELIQNTMLPSGFDCNNLPDISQTVLQERFPLEVILSAKVTLFFPLTRAVMGKDYVTVTARKFENRERNIARGPLPLEDGDEPISLDTSTTAKKRRKLTEIDKSRIPEFDTTEVASDCDIRGKKEEVCPLYH